MNSQKWITSIKTDSILRELLPMDVQPGMPLPVDCHGRLLLYVPFFCMKADRDCVLCTAKLCEAYFEPAYKRLVAYWDLRCIAQCNSQFCISGKSPTDAKLRRMALETQQLLQDLDDIVEEYKQSHMIPAQSIEKYRDFLRETLMFPEQADMYEGLINDQSDCL